MKSSDAVIIGGGIIGLTLAISLRKQGLRVLVVERGEPGHEASHAAAGMLAASGLEIPGPLRLLAEESARMYPEFVHELEDESGVKVDLREQGTILISSGAAFPGRAERLSFDQLRDRDPEIQLALGSGVSHSGQAPPHKKQFEAAYLSERSVDPRALVAAALKAARHRGVDISSGTEVKSVLTERNRAAGVKTDKTMYAAAVVVNCAGAWAGCIGPQRFPVQPVKGQMLAVVGAPAIKHVVRSEKVYLVPRSDGRLLIGSTLEHAGYNKQTDVETIKRLFEAATELLPALGAAKQHDAWAGLRPGTPDELPILGETSVKGYYAASGHYRDGILLAPITAQLTTLLILRQPLSQELAPFSPARFQV